MNIKKVTIENFGPFYGEIELDLQTEPEKPLILIGAQNDRGKTALFNALKFCLYGFEGSNREKSEQARKAINRRASEEEAGKTSVTIEFTHGENDKVYKIDRYIEFEQVDDADSRSVANGPEVVVSEPQSGNGMGYKITPRDSNDKYNEFMDTVLPENASKFFFFDGEQIEKYAQSAQSSTQTTDSDDKVKEAIQTVLGIQEIENAVEDLDDQHSYYQNKLEEVSDEKDELGQIQSEINEKEILKGEKEGEKSQKEEDLERKKERKEGLRDELANAKGVAEARRRIKNIEDDLGSVEDETGLRWDLREKRAEKRKIGKRMGSLAVGIGAEVLKDSEKFDTSLKLGVEEALEYLTDQSECLCGTEIGESEQKILEENLRMVQEDEYHTLLELQDLAETHITCLISGANSTADYGHSHAQTRHSELDTEIKELQSEIQSLEERRDEHQATIDEAHITAEEVEEIENEISDVDTEIGREKGKIEDLEAEIEELDDNIDNLNKKLERLGEVTDEQDRLRTLVRTARECRDAWENIKNQYVEDQKSRVENHASDVFIELTNKDSVYKSLSITNDYELSIKTITGDRDIEAQDPSKGARQILAYSFIAGLNQFTARNAPVVIDTPIGRLDPEHKRNLLEYYPTLQNQVVILYQPGELNERDLEKMEEDTSHYYRINQREDYPESSAISRGRARDKNREVMIE